MRSIAFVLTLCALAAVPLGSRAEDPDDDAPGRLYSGIGVVHLKFSDELEGLVLDDVSAGAALYLGFHLREPLSLELSYDAADAIDRSDVAGSGIVRFDVVTERRTAAIAVLREVSLAELLNWRRDWRLFGLAGIYRSDLTRTITHVAGSSARTETDERITGALLGAGVIYRVGAVELRGYVRKLGILDRSEATEAGAAVQLRF